MFYDPKYLCTYRLSTSNRHTEELLQRHMPDLPMAETASFRVVYPHVRRKNAKLLKEFKKLQK